MIQTLAGINSTASALSAERVRMEVISQNIANANTTHGLDGKPYQRQHVIFSNVLEQAQAGAASPHLLEVSRIEKDSRPPRLVYSPGHPDANGEGMVALPAVDIHEEMADMIVSSRAFEANLAVVKNSRSMAMQTLSIGRH